MPLVKYLALQIGLRRSGWLAWIGSVAHPDKVSLCLLSVLPDWADVPLC